MDYICKNKDFNHKNGTCDECKLAPIHKSDCCQAEVKVISADEGTSHWECEKCGKSCNDTFYKATKEISKTFGRAIKRLGEAEWECECGEKVLPNERHTCKEEEREQSGFTRGLRLEKKAMKILDELMGKGNWEAKELNLIKSFAHAEIEKAKQSQLKEIREIVEKYQKQFHGGGNGRRLFIQLLSELKELEK